ncbi:nuclear transport factor 2 family protein [Bordetella sp. BOR01]|uniref:nuclear transport factor 2 family protein n=1 Tax=Bordetella sp. BOR01 TaxID=2854779 RepID=UPI001C47B224|nr:nuclear transport factor 2 family protein [Bordetella sp. BOR01]MBV7486845.1 nuclear transport factor 2 family protein [Bordetella sp. BOR01]
MIDVSTRVQLEALNAEFAWLIDRGDSSLVAELFTEDGVYERSTGQASRGRAELRLAYAGRAAAGPRTSRHIYTNFRFEAMDERRVRGSCILTLFAENGEPPLPAEPLLVADYDDEYLLDKDGQWRFLSRRVTWIFRNPKRQDGGGLPLGGQLAQ